MGNRTKTDADSPTGDRTAGLEIVLWVRRPVGGSRTSVIDRLSRLRAEGFVDTVTIETWPRRVTLTEQTQGTTVGDVYERFQQWADAQAGSVTLPFDRQTTSSVVGRTKDLLTMPPLVLAVYDDGLAGVYPCTCDGDTVSVSTYLDRFEAETGPPDCSPRDLCQA